MSEILALLQNIAPVVAPRILKQMSQVIYGLLISNGRSTMLEISRWTEAGGSYRTIQRWYHSRLLWLQIMWILFTSQLWKAGHEYIAAGDEVVLGKAGKETFGIGRFFASLQQRVIPGLSFFAFSVIDVSERQSYPSGSNGKAGRREKINRPREACEDRQAFKRSSKRKQE